jgi:hypothetical protein
MVPSTTGFDFLTGLPTEGSSALTQDETRLLNCILEWDVRHKLETDWWFVKLHFPVNRRRVLDSVRAIVEKTMAKRKEEDTQNPDGSNDTRREKEPASEHNNSTGQQNETTTIQALFSLRKEEDTQNPDGSNDTRREKEPASEHNNNTGQQNETTTIQALISLRKEDNAAQKDKEDALNEQAQKHKADLANQAQKHSDDLANILKAILALKPVESVAIGSHEEGIVPTVGTEDVVPTVGQALKELVAVINETKRYGRFCMLEYWTRRIISRVLEKW